MRRSGVSRLAASPTMIGAVTVLIVIVAVFLAYNANRGLPFVPTYRLSAELPNAANLVPGNEVRIGGARVGLIESIEPVQHENGSVTATVSMTLDADIEPLPADSTVVVRARSALGLKYLELVKGTSSEGFAQGAVMPLASARPEPVDLDEVLGMFDQPTQRAVRANLVEFGNALAGRGPELNSALGELPRTLRYLEPVMRNLAAPQTGLGRFVRALAAAAAEVAPVAETQAQMFAALEATFGALAEVARPYIQETISESPPTLETATATLPRIRPFLANSAALFGDLGPAARALRANAPVLASALETGLPAVRVAPQLNRELPPIARSLEAFNDDPTVRSGLARLRQTGGILSPTLRFITPAQSVCNYGSLLLRNVGSMLGERNSVGSWQRFIVFEPPAGPNSEGGPSAATANGPGIKNFLHFNPYPNTAAPGQPRECEAGNEPYIVGRQVIGNVPGNQGTVTDGQR
ncbi:MAG TPA: MlaD family protein [Solirubrobacterales bacterium]|nr:MlaD family protein [Solirubrobacterales bacterium]